MRSVFEEMKGLGIPNEVITEMKDAVDYNLYFLGDKVSLLNMHLVLAVSVVLILAIYIFLNYAVNKKRVG